MQLYTSVSAESSFSHPICPLFRVFALTCPQNGILCTLIVFMSGFCTRSSVHFLGYILNCSGCSFAPSRGRYRFIMHPLAPSFPVAVYFCTLYQNLSTMPYKDFEPQNLTVVGRHSTDLLCRYLQSRWYCIPTFYRVLNLCGSRAQFARWRCSIWRGILMNDSGFSNS